ncbi:MAG: 2-C-methyl-D-erythritol 2,4-cyclodiphosphate synthase [Ruminococcaceae bacterium]|nr:2-C-methyl-D-erythritol 2,4-cyclodiphosphate synthase [Oscillospiraceae bacterium]
MRIGHGYDAHRYEAGRRFVIGGVTVPSDFGMAAHSDGDVLAHALMDALLGAAGLPDIGKQFPDTDGEFKDISSMVLLQRTVEIIRRVGLEIEYVDCTVIAQAPKLSPYIEDMKKTLAENAGIKARQINVKATTEEKMGFTGSLEGIAAHAVCLLVERGRVLSSNGNF